MFGIMLMHRAVLLMIRFLDSHCHLHDSRIIADIEGIVSRAQSAGVEYMATCATMEENFELTAQLSQKYHSILPSFGIHPWFIDSRSEQWKDDLESYLLNYPSGVGETGLDFTDKSWDRDDQIRVFEHHLSLAMELKRPINIHIRKAWEVLVHILKKTGRLAVPGLIHSYSGSADMVPILEKYNLYISFSGSVTNPSAKKVAVAIKKVSADRVVLETDTPDIFPYLDESGSGQESENRRLHGNELLNEPKNLPDIARIASKRAGMAEQEFAAHAWENSKILFQPLLQKGARI